MKPSSSSPSSTQDVNPGNAIPLGRGVQVLKTHPSGLLALSKPAGVRSHPNQKGTDSKALLQLPYDLDTQCYQADGVVWHLLHRLDAPTSGIILLTSSAEQAERIRSLFAERKVKKTYYAIVLGKTKAREELWQDRLKTQHTHTDTVRTERGGSDQAVASMRSLRFTPKPPTLSLLELKPETGRTHQLRIQCAQRRLPIVGDATYGDYAFNRRCAKEWGHKRLFLHAAELVVPLPEVAKGRFCVEDPLPAVFEALVPLTTHPGLRR